MGAVTILAVGRTDAALFVLSLAAASLRPRTGGNATQPPPCCKRWNPGAAIRDLPRGLFLGLCCLAVSGFVGVASQDQPEPNSSTAAPDGKPWFDARLRAFFSAKAAQAHELADRAQQPVATEAWAYFEAGSKGDWKTTTNLWAAMRRRTHRDQGNEAGASLDAVWPVILETDLAWQEFANWQEKHVLAYGRDIIESIPPGSIYFGGTDPGRGVITALSESHAEGKPFFTITQNALADSAYLDYLRAMYGKIIYTPTSEDSKACFGDYKADAQHRLAEKRLKPGENVRMIRGTLEVGGQVAVMSINGLLVKTIFEHNPDRQFYIEESIPLDWMYPYLTPSGPIMKINRQPLLRLSDDVVQQDHAYWSHYLRPLIGDWLQADTTIADITAFVEKVYLKRNLDGFTGDPQFIEDRWAQRAFSKLRASIGGIYAWRFTDAKTPREKQRMKKEAEFAFSQAFVLCPSSPEGLYRYVNFLVSVDRVEDARLLAESGLKLDTQGDPSKTLPGQSGDPIPKN